VVSRDRCPPASLAIRSQACHSLCTFAHACVAPRATPPPSPSKRCSPWSGVVVWRHAHTTEPCACTRARGARGMPTRKTVHARERCRLCTGAAGFRLSLRGGVDLAGLDGAAESSDHDSSASIDPSAAGDGAQDASETQMDTGSGSEDSSAILERGARGSMGAGLSDMETLRSIEQAVRKNMGLQGGSRREQGEAASSQLDKGGEALLRMLSGDASGQVDAEAVARLTRGILLAIWRAVMPSCFSSARHTTECQVLTCGGMPRARMLSHDIACCSCAATCRVVPSATRPSPAATRLSCV
jgi:hypothetical protein